MNLKKLLCIVLPGLALQACVSTPSLNEAAEKLTVYPDNRVSFVSSDGGHAWSNDNNILALRINGRLINARDIASIRAIDLRTTPKPLRIDVQLRTGEHIIDDVADWGYGVEWAACTPARSCKYLDRPYQQHKTGAMDFPTFPKLLSTLADRDIEFQAERLVTWKRPSSEAKVGIRQDPEAILPTRVSDTTLTFSPSFQVPNTTTMVEAEMKTITAIADCANEKRGEKAQRERDAEAAFMRSNPSAAEVRNRARYKAMQPDNFLTDWSVPECTRKIRR
jgi:hypothetical protein